MKNLAILIVVLGVVGYFGYRYFGKAKLEDRSMDSGEIKSNDLMTGEQKARFLKENAGEDADGQSERKTTHGNISADGPAPAATSTAAASSTPASAVIPGGPAITVEPAKPVAAEPVAATAATMAAPMSAPTSSMAAPPTTDTIAPNPPNGMVFSGKGTYQWYRQGNITWRVDTVTGRSCIVFATDEEWRKLRVLSHGCGRNA